MAYIIFITLFIVFKQRKKMNKSVLGTILGAAILGLAKNTGSKSIKLPFFVDLLNILLKYNIILIKPIF